MLVLEKSPDYTEDSDISSVQTKGMATRNTSSLLVLKQKELEVNTLDSKQTSRR